MPDVSPLRILVGALEKELNPPLQRVLGSSEFGDLVTLATRAESSVRRTTESAAAHVWHLVNLPAGSDVQRVRVLVAELDGEVRRLQRIIDEQEEGLHRDHPNSAGDSA